MQLVKLTHNGKTYDLGYIMPLFIENKQQYVIIPNFDFRPPFIVWRLERAQQMMAERAKKYLNSGGDIIKLVRGNIQVMHPLHHITA